MSLLAITPPPLFFFFFFFLGRMFNHQLLDMIEFGLSEFRAALSNTEVSSGTKPCILFQGVAWQQSPEHARIKSLFLDFFRGPEVQNVSLVGFELAIQFTAVQKGFLMRSYRLVGLVFSWKKKTCSVFVKHVFFFF